MAKKRKTNPDHKCLAVRVAYQVNCSCGWSSTFVYGGKFGAGGRAGAYEEWYSHLRACEHATGQEGRA